MTPVYLVLLFLGGWTLYTLLALVPFLRALLCEDQDTDDE